LKAIFGQTAGVIDYNILLFDLISFKAKLAIVKLLSLRGGNEKSKSGEWLMAYSWIKSF
jgi:hypothetical protein